MKLKHYFSLSLLLLINFSFAQSADELYKKASTSYDDGEFKAAIKLLKKAISEAPTPDQYLLLANSYDELEEYGDEFKALNEGLEAFPESAWLYNERALFFQRISKPENAIRDYSLGIKYAENDSIATTIRINRGTAKSDMRDFQGAYDDYMVCYEFDSTRLSTLNNLAMVCDEIGKNDQVLGYLLKVIEIDSNAYYAYGNIGFTYQSQGQYEESLPYFDKVIEGNPDEPYALSNRSYTRMKLGDLKGALEDINKSIKIYPGNSYAYRNRALIYLEMDKSKKACADIETALEYGFTQMYGREVISLQRKFCN